MKFNLLSELIDQGPVTVRITGACMEDVMPRGSSVRLERKALYWPGDIVTFQRAKDELVSHRFLGYLLGSSGWLAITRADRSGRADGPFSTGQLLGRVVSIDNDSFKPAVRDRAAALGWWFPAAFRSIVSGILVRVSVKR